MTRIVKCKSCDAERPETSMLLIQCNLHHTPDRDCLCPFYVCRPAMAGRPPEGNGHRPDCLAKSVMGADIHRIVLVPR